MLSASLGGLRKTKPSIAEIAAGVLPPPALGDVTRKLECALQRRVDLSARRGAIRNSGALSPETTFTNGMTLAERREMQGIAARVEDELRVTDAQIERLRQSEAQLKALRRDAMRLALAERRASAVADLRRAYDELVRSLGDLDEIARLTAGEERVASDQGQTTALALLADLVRRKGGNDGRAA